MEAKQGPPEQDEQRDKRVGVPSIDDEQRNHTSTE
jgi:hypothetical protein